MLTRLLLSLSLVPVLLADITGNVVDQSDAPVAGVIVNLRQKALVKQTSTDDQGAFHFPGLAAGDYRIEISQPPFKPKTITAKSTAAPIKIVLELGEVRTQVTVTDESPRIDTTSSENLGTVQVEAEDLKGLPVLSGDYLSVLAELAGGPAAGPGGATIVVDGIEMDARSVPLKSIQQVRINRDPYTSEFARPGRGRIEITTRDATKDFHGSLEIGVRNSALDARNAFAPARPDEQRRRFAGFLSGPLDRSGKTSFMISAEHEKEDLQSLIYAQTPSGLVNTQAPAPQSESDYLVKIRRLLGDKHVLTFRYDSEVESARNQGLGGFNLPETAVNESGRDHGFLVQHTAFLTPSLVTDLSFQWETSRGLTESITQGVRRVEVSGAFAGGSAQQDSIDSEKEMSVKYVASWSKGKHLVRGGVEIPDWGWEKSDDLSNRQGTYEFASLEDYLAGRPYAFVQQIGNGAVRLQQRSLGIFLQDTFNVRPGLTLGLGVRYDRQNFVSDGNNIAPRFSIAYAPGKARKDVLRAGFGIFYQRFDSDEMRDVLLLGSGGLTRLVISQPSWPEPGFGGTIEAGPPPTAVRLASDLRSPYLSHFSAGWERKLSARTTASANYTRIRGVSMYRSRDLNAPLPGTLVRPDAAYGIVRQIESSATMKSDSLELGISGRLSKFFSGTVQYTLGKVMSNADSESALPPNSYDLRSEWSRSNDDRRHGFRAIGNIQAHKWFQTGIVLSAGSGTPYSLVTGRDDNRDGLGGDRPFGIARNTLQGPGSLRLDVRWTREFKLTGAEDAPELAITADAFNVLNRVNYSGYVGNMSSPFFGRAVSAGPARRLQFGLQFSF